MHILKIKSVSNPKIKRIIRLRGYRDRAKEKIAVVEGIREFMLAVDAGVEFLEIYVSEGFLSEGIGKIIANKIKLFDISVFELSKPAFSKISYCRSTKGILGVFRTRYVCSLDSFPLRKHAIFFVIEGIEKPGNIGAILRTCDAVGVDGVFLCDCKTDIYNPNVIRSSLGTVFSLKTISCSSSQALDFFRLRDIKIYAASPDAEIDYFSVGFRQKVAIVVGSEDRGLSDFWLNSSDRCVGIPMRGKIDSLNVSVSAAVLLYEALRQRGAYG